MRNKKFNQVIYCVVHKDRNDRETFHFYLDLNDIPKCDKLSAAEYRLNRIGYVENDTYFRVLTETRDL